MKKMVVCVLVLLLAGCVDQVTETVPPSDNLKAHDYPKIGSWLSKKDELLASGHPYDLIMTGWVTPEEAERFRNQNPDIIMLVGATVNWIYDDPGWKLYLETIASGDGIKRTIKESMFLKRPNGEKCAFGWASQEWGHQEIYAMNPQDSEWIELVLAAYRIFLEQPEHDGVFVDMVLKVSWCPDALSDEAWASATGELLKEIKEMAEAQNKPVIFNSGRDFSDIDVYQDYMDGYVMENFLGEWGADYETGLKAADSSYVVIYAVDTDDTGVKNLKRMRLGLTLSLLNDNTYFTYDVGPRDHGQAWWFLEYDANLGLPLGEYYKKDNAYWRDFENGVVVSSPYTDVTVTFEVPHTDVTTGTTAQSFTIEKGDGRIFVRADTELLLQTSII